MKVLTFTDSRREKQVVLVEIERSADGSLNATWHSPEYRRKIETRGPGVMGDDGEMVAVDSAEMLYRYAAKLYQGSSMIEVRPD